MDKKFSSLETLQLLLHNLHIVKYFLRNVWREAAEKPLNRQFVSADVRERGAELAQVQRNAPVVPPRADFAFALAGVRESSAECAKANAYLP